MIRANKDIQKPLRQCQEKIKKLINKVNQVFVTQTEKVAEPHVVNEYGIAGHQVVSLNLANFIVYKLT